MSAADAYAAAAAAIEAAKRGAATTLELAGDSFLDLHAVPREIEALTALENLQLDGTRVTDLASLEALTALKTLSLDGTPVADLAPLRRLTSLKSLRLDRTQVADLAPLQALTALETLRLNGTPVADLAPLQALTALETLRLNETRVADLAPLQALSALTTLGLGGTRVVDLAPLQALTRLKTLRLAGTPVADLEPLQALTALHILWLTGTQVADLLPLRALTEMELLWLDETPVADLSPLRGLTALGTLVLAGTQVADLSPLQGLTALEALWLDRTQVTDLAPLQALTALQTLGLDGTPVADLAPLRALTALQTLGLDGTQVADLTPLRSLTALQTLSLDRTQVADLTPLQPLTTLKMLRIDGTQVADLRPIQDIRDLVVGAGHGLGGLRFQRCLACALDPEGLGRLSQIEGDVDRTEKTLAYLRELTAWPPEPPVAPEQDDVLRVAPNAEGKLDIASVNPGAEEVAERLKRTLYARLREGFGDLARTASNQQPEVGRRARDVEARLPEDFAAADLLDVYLEVAWVRGEFDRRSEREGDARFSNAAVAALNEILVAGPGILLDNPEVETLERRLREFWIDPLPAEAAAAQNAVAASIVEAAEAFGEELRRVERATLSPSADPSDRRGGVQRILGKNTVIMVGLYVADRAAGGLIEGATHAIAQWLINNYPTISVAAAGWGDMLPSWLAMVLEQARAIAASAQAAGGLRPPLTRR